MGNGIWKFSIGLVVFVLVGGMVMNMTLVVTLANRVQDREKVIFERMLFIEQSSLKLLTELDSRTRDLELKLNEHERLRNLERFARSLCIDGRTEACGILGPIIK